MTPDGYTIATKARNEPAHRPAGPAEPDAWAIDARHLTRTFGPKVALDGVSLAVPAGGIHALLGPNGAGKTTLVRILAGLQTPTSGTVSVTGVDVSGSPRALRSRIGFIPSGDRSFYLRLSGLENLVFFARLYGLRRKQAVARARELLGRVGLADAERVPVGVYSHGMQKRLSVARAFVTDPVILLVDEATHDLDPQGAESVRDLVEDAAADGAAVIWATQRLDEIRGFAHQVTLLNSGRTCFAGTVPELLEYSVPRRYLLRLRNGTREPRDAVEALQRELASLGKISAAPGRASEHFILSLAEGVVLGDALAALDRAHMRLMACRQERSDVEEAFLALTRGARP